MVAQLIRCGGRGFGILGAEVTATAPNEHKHSSHEVAEIGAWAKEYLSFRFDECISGMLPCSVAHIFFYYGIAPNPVARRSPSGTGRLETLVIRLLLLLRIVTIVMIAVISSCQRASQSASISRPGPALGAAGLRRRRLHCLPFLLRQDNPFG